MFTSSLRGVLVNLPPPFGGVAGGVSVRFLEDGFVAAYHTDDDSILMRLAGDGGDLALNDEPRPPPAAGWNVHGAGGGVDIDAWLNISTASGGGGGATLAGVTLTLFDATLFNNRHQTLIVESPPPKNDERHVRLRSADIDGELRFGAGGFAGKMSRVRLSTWPATGGGESESESGGENTVSIVIATLVLPGEVTLGALSLFGEPSGEIWRLSHFQLDNGDSRLNLSGIYDGNNTSLSLQLDAPSLPAFLQIFHLSDAVADGRLSLFGNIGWPGAPATFRPPLANRRFASERGRFALSERRLHQRGHS